MERIDITSLCYLVGNVNPQLGMGGLGIDCLLYTSAIRKAESEAYAKLAKAKSKTKKIEDNKLMPSLF